METILNYLDNMFANYQQTSEVLRAKKDLAEMMEDKYNELIAEGKIENEAIGIVISEFGNIQELAEELEIKSNKEVESETKKNSKIMTEDKNQENKKNTEGFIKDDFCTSKQNGMRHLSDMEADEYLFTVKQSSVSIAAGVFLCICSPILIILLSGIQEFVIPLSDGIVAGAGITVLLCIVACAVGLFIISGMKLEKYEYLKKECFTINNSYAQEISNIRESRKGKFTIKITAGVIMCILSVIPLILIPAFFKNDEENFLSILSVIFLMIIVGIAVFLFITAGMEEESYKVILQEKEFSVKKKSGKKIENIISAVYWPVIFITYLAWSFICGGWGYTWLIWPLAGILFDFICKIIESAAAES